MKLFLWTVNKYGNDNYNINDNDSTGCNILYVFFKPKGALSLTFFERVQIVDLLAVDIHLVKSINVRMYFKNDTMYHEIKSGLFHIQKKSAK